MAGQKVCTGTITIDVWKLIAQPWMRVCLSRWNTDCAGGTVNSDGFWTGGRRVSDQMALSLDLLAAALT